MLLFNQTLNRLIRFTVVIVVISALTGCGFTPLYGQGFSGNSNGIQLKNAMASIDVKPIPDRIGQMMRTELKRGLSPKKQASLPEYILKVSLSESLQRLSVSQNSFATRGNLHVSAFYELTDTISGAKIIDGTLKTVASYNILSSDFATQTARENAQHLAIIELAQMLRSRIAVHFTKAKLNQAPSNSNDKNSRISPKNPNGIDYGYPN